MTARRPALTRRQLAAGLIALGVALILLTAAAMGLYGLLEAEALAESQFGSGDALGLVVFALQALSFFAVGSLLTLRHPENAVGWICLTIALAWFVIAATSAVGEWALVAGRVGLANWMGTFGGLWVVSVGLMATHLPLRLPDGRHLSPRWRRFSWVCTAILVLIGLGFLTMPGEVNGLPGTENPLGTTALQVLAPVFVLLPLSFLIAIASLVVRYRRSDGELRLQIRTIAFGGLIFLLFFLASLSNLVGLYPSGGALEIFFQNMAVLAYNAVPVSILIAVFRYRLYDIDVVINRALVYSTLTASLAAAYLVGVLLLQLALGPLTDRSDLAVAGSTLAVAGLFRPARTRIQAFVDRRFYRSRYHAGRTLEAFGVRLREQLDLATLGADLQNVVRETVQPAHVSLWLKVR